jgi:hypothetical protein
MFKRILKSSQNYAITKAFLSGLEYLAPDIYAVETLRGHSVYIAFEKRWQLPVYFQLRWREIIGELEKSLGETTPKFISSKYIPELIC